MLDIVSEEKYSDGEVVIKEGGSGDWIYKVLSGEVEIFRMIGDRILRVDVIGRGEIFGEISFLTNTKRSASARAVGDVCLGIVDRDFFDGEMNKLSGEFKKIITCLVDRLIKTTEVVCSLRDSRREDQRIVRTLRVVFKKEEAFVKAYLDNISGGGLFIRTDDPFKQGERFSISIEVAGLDHPINAECEVVWASRSSIGSEVNPKGMGCRFINMSDEDKEMLRKFIAKA
ncbi:MAG: TIGR02266 family protein [Pseudomonadota bacterium]